MLELLHIENIAIIEAADIEFAPGVNALPKRGARDITVAYVH